MWTLQVIENAKKELDTLGKSAAREILSRLKEQVRSQDDPTLYAQPLKRELFGLWRLRVEDYEVIFRVLSDTRIVQLTRIAQLVAK